jgi:Fe-S cluster assembly protein SufD
MVIAPATDSPLAGNAAPSASGAWSEALLRSLAEAGPLPPADPARRALIETIRRHGRESLGRVPFPSRRQEDWRFTPLDTLSGIEPRLLPAPLGEPASPWPEPDAAVPRLVLDGRSDPLAGGNLPAGITELAGAELESLLGEALVATGSEDHWPVHLNQAACSRLLALRITAPLAGTLELVSDTGSASGVLPLRLLLVLEEGASLELLQVHRGAGASLTNVVLEARLAAGSRLHHGLLADGREDAAVLAHLAVDQAPGSHYHLAQVSAGWGLARFEPRIVQRAGAAVTRLRALQVAEARQVADTHSEVRFAGPDGELDQLHKAIADGAARSVFNGAVAVPRQAQRTRAAQLSRNLLLSERARVDTKPQLEIVADDVTCTHGATVSRLQQEELFYLRSRGIDSQRAAHLLLRGFCDEALRELPGRARDWQPLRFLPGGEVSGR